MNLKVSAPTPQLRPVLSFHPHLPALQCGTQGTVPHSSDSVKAGSGDFGSYQSWDVHIPHSFGHKLGSQLRQPPSPTLGSLLLLAPGSPPPPGPEVPPPPGPRGPRSLLLLAPGSLLPPVLPLKAAWVPPSEHHDQSPSRFCLLNTPGVPAALGRGLRGPGVVWAHHLLSLLTMSLPVQPHGLPGAPRVPARALSVLPQLCTASSSSHPSIPALSCASSTML